MFENTYLLPASFPFKEKITSFFPFIVIAVSLVLSSMSVFSLFHQTNTSLPASDEPGICLAGSSKTEVTVYVSGAVVHPGLYKVESGQRVGEALDMAGGITEAADTEYLYKNAGLAEEVKDGSTIYIPFAETKTGSARKDTTENKTSKSSLISINSATSTELETLSGVGKVTAQKIIENRPYTILDELVGKKVISNTLFQKIEKQIQL